MPERIVLDPAEKSEGRTELEITPWVDVEGVDWGDAEMEAYKAEAQIGESVLDFRLPNRQIVAPLVIKDAGGTSFAKARSYIQAKAALYLREGGIGKRILDSGDAVYFDIVANGLTLGGDWLQANRHVDVNAELRLEAVPDFYEPEELVAEAEEKTAAELIKVIDDPGGDMPARVRVVVEEKQGADQKGLIWSFRSRHYSAAVTAKSAYEAEELTALGEASKGALAGASGGTVVSHNALTTAWTPVLGTNRAGTSFLTHEGSYRFYARMRSTSGTAVAARLVWDVGDLVNPTENAAWRFPGGSAFYIADLGEVRLSAPPIGSHRWQGQVQGIGSEGEESIDIDKIWILNADDGMGILSAPPRYTTLSSVLGWDNFSTTSAGTITGKAAPVGGTWTAGAASGMDAVGFTVNTVNQRISRSEKSDANLNNGYYARLGTGTAVSCSAQADIYIPFQASNMRQGVFVRLSGTEAKNWLMAAYEPDASGGGFGVFLKLFKRVAGTVTPLAETFLLPNAFERIRTLSIEVDSAGAVVVYDAVQGATLKPVLAATDSALAGGGALETGGYGVYDAYSGSSGSPERWYDNVLVSTSVKDAVLYANQKLQLGTTGAFRIDSGGSAYAPVSRVIGDLPRLPAGGLENRPTELTIKSSRGDCGATPDSAMDDLATKVYASRSWLTVPGTI